MKHLKRTLLVSGLLMIGFCVAYLGMPAKAQLGDLNLNDLDVKKLQDGGQQLMDSQKAWSYPDERATGRVLAARVAKSFGGIWTGTKSADAWEKYVNMIGRSLVPYSKRPDIKYRFAILNSDDVNAYSCPGGYIFLTKGLLKKVNNEAELAGVIAHEIGHVSERHIENEIKKQNAAAGAMNIGMAVAQGKGDLTADQVKMIESVSQTGYDTLVKTGYSKADEFGADIAGTRNIYKMGYDPMALASFLKTLGGNEKSADLKILLSTHPASSARMDKIKDYVKKKGWNTAQPDLTQRLQDMKSKYPVK